MIRRFFLRIVCALTSHDWLYESMRPCGLMRERCDLCRATRYRGVL